MTAGHVADTPYKRALSLARTMGWKHGHDDAIFFLFAGAVDDDAILVLDERISRGDVETIASLPKPQDGLKDYPPNNIALLSGLMSGESPYTMYLDVCEAYDQSYYRGIAEHVKTVSMAIKAGLL